MMRPVSTDFKKLSLTASRGISLTELIVSLGLFGIILATCLSALSQSLFVSNNAHLESEANTFLANEMEKLRNLSWSDFTALPAKAEFSSPSPSNNMQGTRLITERQADQYSVRLQVNWLNSQDQPRSISAVNFFSQRGLAQ